MNRPFQLFHVILVTCLALFVPGCHHIPVETTPKLDMIALDAPRDNFGPGSNWIGTSEVVGFEQFNSDATTFDGIKKEIRNVAIPIEVSQRTRTAGARLDSSYLKKLSIDVGADFNSSSEYIESLDPGEILEHNVTLTSLSEALARGWFGFPITEGFPYSYLSIVSGFELNRWEDSRSQPVFIQRCLISNGLTYTLTDKGLRNFNAELTIPDVLDAGGSFQNKKLYEKKLEVDIPMTLAYDTVQLTKIDPPLPPLRTAHAIMQQPSGPVSRHTFYWKNRKGEEFKVPVDLGNLFFVQKTEKVRNKLIQGEVSLEFAPKGLNDYSSEFWTSVDEVDQVPGDSIVRIRLQLDEPGYAYISNIDSDNRVNPIYPRYSYLPKSIGDDTQLPAGVYYFPEHVDPEAFGWGLKDRQKVLKETFLVTLSRNRIPDYDKVVKTASIHLPHSENDLLRGQSDSTGKTQPFGLESRSRFEVIVGNFEGANSFWTSFLRD